MIDPAGVVVRRAALALVLAALPLLFACARSGARAGDSVVAAVDSIPPSAMPAVTPPAGPVDSTTTAPPAATGTKSAPTPTPTPTATPSETVLTGRVTVGGLASDQRTVLQIEGGPATTLTGPLEPELRTLNSASVWVTGAPVSGPPNASFAVSRYEIVSIDGAKPVVGVLTSRGDATWLAAERDTVKLATTTPEIRAKIGAKVWIVGRRSGSELTPQSFGVIRER